MYKNTTLLFRFVFHWIYIYTDKRLSYCKDDSCWWVRGFVILTNLHKYSIYCTVGVNLPNICILLYWLNNLINFIVNYIILKDETFDKQQQIIKIFLCTRMYIRSLLFATYFQFQNLLEIHTKKDFNLYLFCPNCRWWSIPLWYY